MCQHARSGNFNSIVPVIVTEAEGVRKVHDRLLREARRILRDKEVGRPDRSLRHAVRHQEKVEGSVDHLGLLNEFLIDVSSLRWVVNVIASVKDALLEEPLFDALVYDDQGDIWRVYCSSCFVVRTDFTGLRVLFSN